MVICVTAVVETYIKLELPAATPLLLYIICVLLPPTGPVAPVAPVAPVDPAPPATPAAPVAPV